MKKNVIYNIIVYGFLVFKKDTIENSLLSLFLLENTVNDIVDLSLILSE